MVLARNNNTPIPFFLSCPLSELPEWIRTNNEIVKENQQNKSSQKKRRG